MALAIHLLGTPRVERDGHALPAPRGRKVWALLAYLARHHGGVSRTHLAGLLFEDADDPLAALRWNLSELRRLVGDAGLRGDVIALALERSSYVDIAVVSAGTWAEAVGVPGLDRELLEGMRFAACPSFDVWLATERRHLQATAEAGAARGGARAARDRRGHGSGRPRRTAGATEPARREFPGAAGPMPRCGGRRRRRGARSRRVAISSRTSSA